MASVSIRACCRRIPGASSTCQRTILADGVVITGAGIAWSPAGIVFSRNTGLWIVPDDRGEPRSLTTLDPARGEMAHDHPVVLPGERFVLFSILTANAGGERIEAVSIDGRAQSVVVERAIGPVWSPTNHLLFGRDGAVLAVPLDPESGRVRGEAVPILSPGVVRSNLTGAPGVSVSSTGTLLYVPENFLEKRVVSVGRDGGRWPSTCRRGRMPTRESHPTSDGSWSRRSKA